MATDTITLLERYRIFQLPSFNASKCAGERKNSRVVTTSTTLTTTPQVTQISQHDVGKSKRI